MFLDEEKPPPGSTVENITDGSGNFPGGVDFSLFPGSTYDFNKSAYENYMSGNKLNLEDLPDDSADSKEPGKFDVDDIASSSKWSEIMKYNLIDKGFEVDDKGNFVGQEPTFIDYLKAFPNTYGDKVRRDEGFAKKNDGRIFKHDETC